MFERATAVADEATLARDARATPAATEPARRAPAPSVPDALLEAQQVARAERMVMQQPREALRMVRSLASSDTLREEREYIEVVALLRLGRGDEARAASRRFLARYPESAFARAVRASDRQLTTGT